MGEGILENAMHTGECGMLQAHQEFSLEEKARPSLLILIDQHLQRETPLSHRLFLLALRTSIAHQVDDAEATPAEDVFDQIAVLNYSANRIDRCCYWHF